MIILGLQGSPKQNGSSDYLLNLFSAEIEKMDGELQTIDAARKNIKPCIGCGHCAKKGFCMIDGDDMAGMIYRLLREAEIIVVATPVFFYSVPAQIKALIDRSQALWSRKYRFKLSDPLAKTRRGFLLSIGGSRGKRLFEGVNLVAKYFFDAIDAEFFGSLTYNKIETSADIEKNSNARNDISASVNALLSPMIARKRILFVGREDACRSQMAAAFMQYYAGDRFNVMSAGSSPVKAIHPDVVTAMAEKDIDVAFRLPRSLTQVMENFQPAYVINTAGEGISDVPSAAKKISWDVGDPVHASSASLCRLRDQIQKKVQMFIQDEA